MDSIKIVSRKSKRKVRIKQNDCESNNGNYIKNEKINSFIDIMFRNSSSSALLHIDLKKSKNNELNCTSIEKEKDGKFTTSNLLNRNSSEKYLSEVTENKLTQPKAHKFDTNSIKNETLEKTDNSNIPQEMIKSKQLENKNKFEKSQNNLKRFYFSKNIDFQNGPQKNKINCFTNNSFMNSNYSTMYDNTIFTTTTKSRNETSIKNTTFYDKSFNQSYLKNDSINHLKFTEKIKELKLNEKNYNANPQNKHSPNKRLLDCVRTDKMGRPIENKF